MAELSKVVANNKVKRTLNENSFKKNSLEKSNVLKNIVEHKEQELIRRKAKVPLSVLKQGLQPSQRSLQDALAKPGNRFILEYKRASPSRGDIRPDLTVEQCVAAYQDSADALSVLTDQKFFNGSHQLLQSVSSQVEQPVLCKDFFIDEYQVYEARYYHADAILLMLSVLNDEEYQHLKMIADSLNLDVLTEVHSSEEAQRAVALNAPIIGINNRDLTVLKTNLAVTESIAPKLPVDRIIISESGINNRCDVTRLAEKVDGFLIGTSLMQALDIELATKQLVYSNVKICGVKDAKVAQHCFASGASYVGFMFYPASKRFIEPVKARQIISQVAGRYVGVFVEDDVENIVRTVDICGLDVVQLHGNQSIETAENIKRSVKTELWKALALSRKDDLDMLPLWLEVADKVLLDYKNDRSFGGTGESFDWQWLNDVFSKVPPEKIIVAGGIDKNNLPQLFDYPVTAIDLSSGVEITPGEKDSQKITEFFALCRSNGKF